MVHIQPDFLRCDSLYCAFHFRLIVFGSVLSFLLNIFYCVWIRTLCNTAWCLLYVYIYIFCTFLHLSSAWNVESQKELLTNIAYGARSCVCVHGFSTRSIWTCNMFGTSIRSRANHMRYTTDDGSGGYGDGDNSRSIA